MPELNKNAAAEVCPTCDNGNERIELPASSVKYFLYIRLAGPDINKYPPKSIAFNPTIYFIIPCLETVDKFERLGSGTLAFASVNNYLLPAVSVVVFILYIKDIFI